MTWALGPKPHLISATAQNPDSSWSSGICNFTSDRFLNVRRRGDDKWNVEQGGQTPAQAFQATLQVDELRARAAVPFVVRRTNDTLKNARAQSVTMRNGALTISVAPSVAPMELAALRSAPSRAPFQMPAAKK